MVKLESLAVLPTTDPSPQHQLTISDSEAAVIGAVVGAFVAIVAMLLSRRTARQRATLDFIRSMEIDGDYQLARKSFIEARDGKISFVDAIKSNEDAGRHFRYLLNTHELMAIGIRGRILDDTLYHRWYRSTVINDWDVTSQDGYIDYERSKKCEVKGCEKPCHLANPMQGCQYNEGIFKEYELLATRWKKHKQPAHIPPGSFSGRVKELLRLANVHKFHIMAYSVLILAIVALVWYK